MPRLAGLALLAISSCAPGIAVAQSAPLSPFELAQSIDSGSPIDWNATWKKLGRTDEPPPSLVHCGDPQFWSCSTELITVPSPSQIIMLVQPEYGGDDSCLRFMKQGDGWKFTGYHEAYLKYYPRRHEMLRFAGKPFLEISVQGASGSGLASETAEWFDLTLPGFEPAFSFPVQGHNNLLPSAIGWQVQGDAMQERDSAVEAIHLFLTVRFDFDGEDLSGANFSGIYERSPGKRSSRSSAPTCATNRLLPCRYRPRISRT